MASSWSGVRQGLPGKQRPCLRARGRGISKAAYSSHAGCKRRRLPGSICSRGGDLPMHELA